MVRPVERQQDRRTVRAQKRRRMPPRDHGTMVEAPPGPFPYETGNNRQLPPCSHRSRLLFARDNGHLVKKDVVLTQTRSWTDEEAHGNPSIREEREEASVLRQEQKDMAGDAKST